MIGSHFERWTVVSFSHKRGEHIYWNCRCECGAIRPVRQRLLKNGKSRSCGCLQKEVARKLAESRTTHGKTDTPEYETWQHIIDRCFNPKNKQYKDYGGRGISMDSGWRKSFPDFLAAVGPRPSAGYSIDRYPDNNGDYYPGNVRWATATEQNRNRRSNHVLEFDGQKRTMSEWAGILGINLQTLASRLNLMKWPVDKALTLPRRKTGRLGRPPQ